ncbi:MAG TPA: hypothetical protein VF131_04430 [Blastocatellia bacterium]|nr:hypothetical protein [Blastocatellia bacterium]
MSLKESFSAEEWNTLVKAPMMVSYGVAGAAPSGGIGFVKEMKAVADAIFDAGEQYPESSLVGAVTRQIKANATDGSEGPEETLSAGEIKERALEVCRQVNLILQSKASAEEADSYRGWLMTVAQKVAEASKEGGFLGFGGARVSDSETAALSEIEAALGVSDR